MRAACVLALWSGGLPLPPSGAEFLKGRKCFRVHLIVSIAWQRTGLKQIVRKCWPERGKKEFLPVCLALLELSEELGGWAVY